MGIETPNNSPEQPSSFLSGSLIPKWLHERFTGIWGRFSKAFDKAKELKDGGVLSKIGTFFSELFGDYQGLTKESAEAKEKTAKEATEFINKNATPDDVTKSLKESMVGNKQLSPEEQTSVDMFSRIASNTWLNAPEKYDVTIVTNSLLSDSPGVKPSDVSLDQKLSAAKFSLRFSVDLKKYCTTNNISVDDLAKKLDTFESATSNGKVLKALKLRIKLLFNAKSFSTSSVIGEALSGNTGTLMKLNRLKSQVPVDKIKDGTATKSDFSLILPNTISNDSAATAVVDTIKSIISKKSVSNKDLATLLLNIDGRDIEKLITFLS